MARPGATWLESAVIAATSCKRSLLNSGLASQACPTSGRRVWAKKKALSIALLLKKEVSILLCPHSIKTPFLTKRWGFVLLWRLITAVLCKKRVFEVLISRCI